MNRGGCQAIEDAYVLTENLANVKSTEKIENSLQDFYRKRILRVSAVQFLSRLASDLIVNAFDTPWSPHDNLGKSWKSYLTFFWKPVLQYAIFPAQFAFLYSYYPSGRMDETAKKLSETWKAAHFESSEKAFKKAEEGFVRETGPSFFQKAETEEAKPEPVLSGLQKLFK
jgi:zeaxanthin epoxidase